MLDMLEVIEPNSIDSIITDPPYELNFMGKGWDNAGVSFNADTWKKCFEVLKPGGYLLAFGGSRTFHRIACAIEDAGFEIRDTIMWLYGSGFPKSLNIGLTLDKKNGVEIKFGDNDTLSAYVSVLAGADLLINMRDTDGFYDSDPRTNPNAKMLKRIEKVDESMYACADGAGSARGTGGMTSKLHAAEIACGNGIPMMIVSGEDFSILYDMLNDGIQHGSYFAPFTK